MHSAKFADHVVIGNPRLEGNIPVALLAGLMAACLGSLFWVGYTAATGAHVFWLALPVAALVGLTVRFVGGGTTPLFGLIAAVFTLLGSLGGQVGAEIFSGMSSLFDFYDVMTRVNFAQLGESLLNQALPFGYIVYAMALFGAYRVAMQKPRPL
jgi:hypothetical protein